MKEVIAREVALQMLKDWADELEASVQHSERLLRAIMSGRLDKTDAGFSYRLLVPVSLDNGQNVDSLNVTEPTADQLREASKGNRDDMDTTIRVISSITGQPIAVINRLKTRDLTTIGEVLDFFG
jgi:hypothetical protein